MRRARARRRRRDRRRGHAGDRPPPPRRARLPVVGVPKTIDNDLAGTDVTIGFDTAVHVCTEAIDRLHTTAESHDRVMVVEVMGRNTGWIAARKRHLGRRRRHPRPEEPTPIEDVCDRLRRRHDERRFSIVVVAEGYPLTRRSGEQEQPIFRTSTRTACAPSGRDRPGRRGRDHPGDRVRDARHGPRPHPARRNTDRTTAPRDAARPEGRRARLGTWGRMVAVRGRRDRRRALEEACAMRGVPPSGSPRRRVVA